MRVTKITLIAIATIIIAACSTTKKSVTIVSRPVVKPDDGLYEPGNEEVTAIQTQYKDVTIEQLKEGHIIYTAGACTNCHGAKNIYQIEDAQWKNILDNMAQKARITDTQKDAVYKYVLAIKATKGK